MPQDSDLKQQAFLRVLLNHYHPGSADAVLKLLPPDEAKDLINLKISSKDLGAPFFSAEDQIEPIHYSWLSDALQKMPAGTQPYAILSLSDSKRKALCQLLKLPYEENQLPQLTRKFFSNKWIEALGMDQILPITFLPDSAYQKFLLLPKVKLVELIDFLGLYDLADEIKGIVNTKNLKDIYACLSARKQQFLRICLHQKEKLITPKLNLDSWNGECKELHKQLHLRGLHRFGLALFGQHPHLLWYITHILDIGRGKILASHISQHVEVSGVTQAIGFQVTNLLNFLEQDSA